MVLSKNHKKGLSLNSYGDGMKKAMLLISAVLKARDGILCEGTTDLLFLGSRG